MLLSQIKRKLKQNQQQTQINNKLYKFQYRGQGHVFLVPSQNTSVK
jgi:hypothetical protein